MFCPSSGSHESRSLTRAALLASAALSAVFAGCGAEESAFEAKTESLLDANVSCGRVAHPLVATFVGNTMQICSSTLIGDQLVATAAHCFDEAVADISNVEDTAAIDIEAQLMANASAMPDTGVLDVNPSVYVYFGCDFGAYVAGGADPTLLGVYRAYSVTTHPSWQVNLSRSTWADWHNDVALIRLPVPAPSGVGPVPLWRQPIPHTADILAQSGATTVYKTAQIGVTHVGYGAYQQVGTTLSFDFKRREGRGIMIGRADLPATIWHFGPTAPYTADTCRGDSGGPVLVRATDGLDYLAGLSSFGASNCRSYGVSTHLPSYTPYLDAELSLAGRSVVKPVLECVRSNGDGTWTGRFGYLNANTVPVTISAGAANKLTPSVAQPPTTFLPGRRRFVFDVTFTSSTPVVWYLRAPDGSARTSTAGTKGPLCVQ